MKSLLSNPGKLLKKLAFVFGIIEIIAALVTAFIMSFNDTLILFALLVIVIAVFAVLLTVVPLYAFGCLVEDTMYIKKYTESIDNKLKNNNENELPYELPEI